MNESFAFYLLATMSSSSIPFFLVIYETGKLKLKMRDHVLLFAKRKLKGERKLMGCFETVPTRYAFPSSMPCCKSVAGQFGARIFLGQLAALSAYTVCSSNRLLTSA